MGRGDFGIITHVCAPFQRACRSQPERLGAPRSRSLQFFGCRRECSRLPRGRWAAAVRAGSVAPPFHSSPPECEARWSNASPRRRRASTIVRVWSNWLTKARAAWGPVVTAAALSGTVLRSVHAAGINERLPSGNTKSRCKWRCRWLQPSTPKVWPSSGCLGRTIRTRSG